jgi:hypothetical protein
MHPVLFSYTFVVYAAAVGAYFKVGRIFRDEIYTCCGVSHLCGNGVASSFTPLLWASTSRWGICQGLL